MGNSFNSSTSKDENKKIIKKQTKKNIKKNTKEIPKSASGRHSLNIEKLTKNLKLEENEILENGRNSIRESLIKTFKHKAAVEKFRKKTDDINDVSNIEFDYNKIFALLFRKENDPFEKSDDLIFHKKNDNGFIIEDIEGENENENDDNSDNKNNKEIAIKCTCRRINEFKRKEGDAQSFVTGISKENSEDFFVKQNGENENIESNEIIGRKALINNTDLEEEKQNDNKDLDSEKFNNIPFEEKSNLKKRKTNLNLKSENKKESINLGLEDFDENLKKKLEKNFEENTKEINEININVNDLTINLKSSNQAVKFSNEIFKSEEETKIKENLENIEKEKSNEENNNDNSDINNNHNTNEGKNQKKNLEKNVISARQKKIKVQETFSRRV